MAGESSKVKTFINRNIGKLYLKFTTLVGGAGRKGIIRWMNGKGIQLAFDF
ncbi:MAG: hypothetical protein Kow0042_28780 [Calditrichia bacterium]